MSLAAARHLSARRASSGFRPLLLLIAIWLLASAGCGGQVSHGDRAPLVGSITVKGEPLRIPATVYFDPVAGKDGIGSAAGVSEGKFTIPEESGPTPGKQYKVTVITAPGIPAEGTPLKEIKQPERFETRIDLPPRGNDPAELKLEFQ